MSRNKLAKLNLHLTGERGDRVAFRTTAGEQLTFGELNERADRWAYALLGAGLTPGQRVACWAKPSLELIVALLACYRAGLIYVPINTSYGRHELTHILEDSQASALIIDDRDPQLDHALFAQVLPQLTTLNSALTLTPPSSQLQAALAPLPVHPIDASAPSLTTLPDVQDEDIAMFIYTSGTTGKSKGVMLSFGAIITGIDNLTTLWRWSPADHLALALPLFHIHGLGIGIHGTLLRGCQTTIMERFDPQQLGQRFDSGATIFMGVPTMYVRLIEAMTQDPALANALSKAKLFTSGSAALSAQSFAQFEALTGHRPLERYGMSETMLTISNPYPPQQRRPGTIGHPIPEVQARIVNEHGELVEPGELGELQVQGPTLMSGYWRQPEKTAAAFDGPWFKTGDVVTLDDHGYIVHAGRQSVDIIKSGGYKISAREIEERILTHPEVAQVAVIGRADQEWGERIIAAIVPTSSAPARDEQTWLELLRAHLHADLAAFKHPKAIILLNELPRNALGKVQKHLIA